MAIRYNEQDKSYTRLNGKGQAMGTVTVDDSLNRYEKLAAEYKAQQGGTPAAEVGGGTTAAPSGYDQYKAKAEEYNRELAAANRRATEAQVAQMTQQVEQARQQTEDANAQAYAAKKISEKNIGQQLAAAGLSSGGAAETTRLQNELNWQNAINENNRNLLTTEQDIANQQALLRAQAEAEQAARDYDFGQNLNNIYLQQLAADKSDEEWRAQLEYQRERDRVADEQYAAGLAADKQAADRDLALKLLNMGYSSEWIAKQLGLNASQIAAMLAQEQAGKVRSGGSGGSGNGKTEESSGQGGLLGVPQIAAAAMAAATPVPKAAVTALSPQSILETQYIKGAISKDEYLKLAKQYGITVY